MKMSRNRSLKIHFLLDNCLPPIIRDAKWFMIPPFRALFGEKSEVFFGFKQRAMAMTEQEFVDVYEQVQSVLIERETDLNTEGFEEILRNLLGQTVLEVGSGRGLLAKKMSARHRVTAVDIMIDPKMRNEHPEIDWREATMERLPFEDGSFDTVVTTHTLEHVQNILRAIQELRRVTKQRLIIVVPKQRPYAYTFDLHLHFFPYPHSLLALMGTGRKNSCREVGGDLFYVEDME